MLMTLAVILLVVAIVVLLINVIQGRRAQPASLMTFMKETSCVS